MFDSLLPLVGLVAGASIASGIRIYATVAVLGFLGRQGILQLPQGLTPLTHTWVIVAASVLYLAEFIADKVPAFDSIWDTVHTFIRIPAAGIIAFAAFGEVAEPWRTLAALASGTIALSAHGIKSGTRLAINTSPEPFSNWGASIAEELTVAGILWLAIAHPIATLVIAIGVVVAAIVLGVWFFRFLGRLFRRRNAPPAEASSG